MRFPYLSCLVALAVSGGVSGMKAPAYGDSLAAAEAAVTDRPTAIVSDRPERAPSEAKRVAREVLELQRELGGSIVPGFAGDLMDEGISESVKPAKTRSDRKSPLTVLRAGSWQMERLAFRLEKLNLYPQADAVRETARRLRLDARRLQAQTGQSVPAVNNGR